jgi:hypothetical protein
MFESGPIGEENIAPLTIALATMQPWLHMIVKDISFGGGFHWLLLQCKKGIVTSPIIVALSIDF